MNDRGKLLVSTKSINKERKVVVCIGGAFLIIMGILCLSVPEAFRVLSRDNYHLISLVFGAFVIVFAAVNILMVFLGGRSYCEVYENVVTGMTAMTANQPNAPMQSFEVKYGDIKNVTESGKCIRIYTPYVVYDVLAMKNRQEALREIRARMAGAEKG